MKQALWVVASVCAAAGSASAQQFWNMGPGYSPTSISDNGIVVGTDDFANQYFRWTPSSGASLIGGVGANDGYGGQATISNDGSRVGGTSVNPITNLGEAALYDVGTGVWTHLGGIGSTVDNSTSSGWGLSGDGQTLVGLGWTGDFQGHAIRWSQGTGLVDMGSTFVGYSSRANTVSDNGTVVGGWQDTELDGRQGAVWVNGVQERIFDGDGFGVSEVLSISGDGQWVTGVTYGLGGTYRYNTVTDAFQYIEPVAGDFFFPTSLGTAISDDGSTIIGQTRDFGPPIFGSGFIWREGFGTMLLKDYFDASGVVYEEGFLFAMPFTMSGDALTFAGVGLSPSLGVVGWVVTVPTPGTAALLGLGGLVGLKRRRR